MLVDCIMYLNEIEVFIARLSVLHTTVSKFYAFEFPMTFTQAPKPYTLARQLDELVKKGVLRKDIRDKVYVVEIPMEEFRKVRPSTSPWDVEERHREIMLEELDIEGLSDNDVVIFTDVDEIPSLNQIIEFGRCQHPIVNFRTRLYRYFFNLYFQDWRLGVISMWKNLKKIHRLKRDSGQTLMRNLRMKERYLLTTDQLGWHFSNVGDFDTILLKSHSRHNALRFKAEGKLDVEYLKKRIRNREHLFKDGKAKGTIHPVESLPTAVASLEYFSPLLLREE